MTEEIYAVVLPDGGTFKCVKSQLAKTFGRCPIYGHLVDETYASQGEAIRAAKVAKLQQEIDKLGGVKNA